MCLELWQLWFLGKKLWTFVAGIIRWWVLLLSIAIIRFCFVLFCFCSCEFSKLHSSRGDISQHGRSYPASSCCLASEWWPSSFPELLDWRIPRLSVCTFAAPILQRHHNHGDCWFCVWECSCCLPGLYNINPCWCTWCNYQHNHRPGDPTSSLIFFFQGFVAHTLEKMHPSQTHILPLFESLDVPAASPSGWTWWQNVP